MSATDESLAAEIAEAERMRAESIAEFHRLALPKSSPLRLSEKERAEADEALRDFHERAASGWYGDEDEDKAELEKLRRVLDEDDEQEATDV